MDDGWPNAGMLNTDIPRFRPDTKIWTSSMMHKPSATDKKRRETNTADIYSMPTSPKRSTENAVHTTTTPCPEKNGTTLFLPLTLPNANRFSNFFH